MRTHKQQYEDTHSGHIAVCGHINSSMSTYIQQYEVRAAQPFSQHQCQHTSAYVSIRQHTSAYVSIRQQTRLNNSVDELEDTSDLRNIGAQRLLTNLN
jgi:hypothetical protein